MDDPFEAVLNPPAPKAVRPTFETPTKPDDPFEAVLNPVPNYVQSQAADRKLWADVENGLKSHFGDQIDTSRMGQDYRLQHKIAAQANVPESASSWLLRKAAPDFGVGQFTTAIQNKAAVDRFNAGQATEEDLNVIANVERFRKYDANRSFGGKAATTLAGIPALVGEVAVGGKLAGSVLGSAGRTAPVLSRAGLAETPAAVLHLIPQTAATPRFWLPGAAENAEQKGGDWYETKNLVPSAALGYMNMAVLGSMSKVPEGLNGPGMSQWFQRWGYRTGVGTTEMQVVNVLAGATGLQTDYGFIGDLANGKTNDALKHAALDVLTFGAFAAFHGRERPPERPVGQPGLVRTDPFGKRAEKTQPVGPSGPVFESFKDALNHMQEMGYSRDEAGKAIKDIFTAFDSLFKRNPKAGPAEARKLFTDMEDGPIKDFAHTLTDQLSTPTTGEAQPGVRELPGRLKALTERRVPDLTATESPKTAPPVAPAETRPPTEPSGERPAEARIEPGELKLGPADARLVAKPMEKPRFSRHPLFDAAGKEVGRIEVHLAEDGILDVKDLRATGSANNENRGVFGSQAMVSLFKQLADTYPAAKSVSGLRASGAHIGMQRSVSLDRFRPAVPEVAAPLAARPPKPPPPRKLAPLRRLDAPLEAPTGLVRKPIMAQPESLPNPEATFDAGVKTAGLDPFETHVLRERLKPEARSHEKIAGDYEMRKVNNEVYTRQQVSNIEKRAREKVIESGVELPGFTSEKSVAGVNEEAKAGVLATAQEKVKLPGKARDAATAKGRKLAAKLQRDPVSVAESAEKKISEIDKAHFEAQAALNEIGNHILKEADDAARERRPINQKRLDELGRQGDAIRAKAQAGIASPAPAAPKSAAQARPARPQLGGGKGQALTPEETPAGEFRRFGGSPKGRPGKIVLPSWEDLKKSNVGRGLRVAADEWYKLTGGQFPRLSRLSKRVADRAAALISAPAFANSAVRFLKRAVYGDMTKAEAAKFYTTHAEMRLEYMRRTGKPNAGTLIGPDSPLKTQTEYAAIVRKPEFKAYLDRWKQHVVPIMNEHYWDAMGLPHGTPIPTTTQIPGIPINFSRVEPGQTSRSAVGSGDKTVKPEAVTQARFGMNKAATGEHQYETDPFKALESIFRKGADAAGRANLDRTIVSEGVGQWGVAGRPIPTTPDGMPMKMVRHVDPEPGTQVAPPRTKNLFIHPDALGEYHDAIGVGNNFRIPLLTPTLQGFTKVAVTSTVDASFHSATLIGKALQPYMVRSMIREMMTAMKPLLKGKLPHLSEGQLERLMEMAKAGETKPPGFESGSYLIPSKLIEKFPWLENLDVTRWGSAFLDTVDSMVRLAADRAFRLMRYKGLVADTAENKRDFQNDVGNYKSQSQAMIVRMLRGSGFGPFATAATSAPVNAIRSLWLSAGVTASSTLAQARLRLHIGLKLATVIAAGRLLQWLVWGNPNGDDHTPFGAIKIGERDGKTDFVDPLRLLRVRRGLSTTGISALEEDERLGVNDRTKVHDVRMAWQHALLHPATGPAVQFGTIQFTGHNTFGTRVAGAPEDNGSVEWENFKAGVKNVNPSLAALMGADKAGIHEKKPLIPQGFRDDPLASIGRAVEEGGPKLAAPYVMSRKQLGPETLKILKEKEAAPHTEIEVKEPKKLQPVLKK